MAMQKVNLGTVTAIAVIGLVASALGALVATQNLNNTATIKAVGVGVYSNSQCTQPVTSIDWGVLTPGQTYTRVIYVKNMGNVPIVLSMSAGNWTPSNANVISVTWNRQGATLAAGSSVNATLSLTVPTNISGVTSFSFVITITGTEKT